MTDICLTCNSTGHREDKCPEPGLSARFGHRLVTVETPHFANYIVELLETLRIKAVAVTTFDGVQVVLPAGSYPQQHIYQAELAASMCKMGADYVSDQVRRLTKA